MVQKPTRFRSILTRRDDLKAESDTDVFYIGVGDQFDDDRRLVRATADNPSGRVPVVGGALLQVRHDRLELIG
jgi:hypothetical protein